MASQTSLVAAARAGTVCAAAMIANQVAGKATRDALFLSNYDVTDLPLMLIAGAALSVVVVLVMTRLLTRLGPGRVIPWAFALSAVLLLGEWALMISEPKIGAVAVYLHLAVFGAILISGFWSLVNERFDPRSAKHHVSRIAAGGTLGGLLGGVTAERVAALLSMASMLPVLAGMHLLCAGLVTVLRAGGAAGGTKAERKPEEDVSGFQHLAREPYLRNIGLLVLVGTVAAGLVDYVFKAEASAAYRGEELMRFFAAFYTALGLLTFLVQSTLSRASLERAGLARTIATLPMALTAGALGMVAAPGLVTAVIARGSESILRSSLFRSGYELLYTPLSSQQRRSTKTIVDVGFDRLGDAVGGGIIRAVLWLLPVIALKVLVGLTVVLAVTALLLTRRLRQGYVEALEKRLVSRAEELNLHSASDDPLTSTSVLQTLGGLDLHKVLEAAGASENVLQSTAGIDAGALRRQTGPISRPITIPPGQRADALVESIQELRSGDPARVLAVLDRGQSPDDALISFIIPLLAWDEVSHRAVISLRGVAASCTGQLVDTLVDPDEEFAIRRRLPRVLSRCSSERAVLGLLQGLGDKRFEVRYQCGRALASIHRRAPDIPISEARVFDAVLGEVRVDRRVWETQRLLDAVDNDDDEGGVVDEFLRDRTSRSLEHVFAMLSLVLPSEPLRIAFRGLHTDDATLRGTALEYLESVLPDEVRLKLWPFLEDDRKGVSGAKPRDEILQSLLKSNESIEISLEELLRQFRAGKGP